MVRSQADPQRQSAVLLLEWDQPLPGTVAGRALHQVEGREQGRAGFLHRPRPEHLRERQRGVHHQVNEP